jgi:hypothetical protein
VTCLLCDELILDRLDTPLYTRTFWLDLDTRPDGPVGTVHNDCIDQLIRRELAAKRTEVTQ